MTDPREATHRLWVCAKLLGRVDVTDAIVTLRCGACGFGFWQHYGGRGCGAFEPGAMDSLGMAIVVDEFQRNLTMCPHCNHPSHEPGECNGSARIPWPSKEYMTHRKLGIGERCACGVHCDLAAHEKRKADKARKAAAFAAWKARNVHEVKA